MPISPPNLFDAAKGLARNPLGIIALFIVLVYGFASLVTAFGSSLTEAERLPLIYFLVVFPVLVLTIFAWLVSKHSEKLYGPCDFKDEGNYLKLMDQRMRVVASLSAATAKGDIAASEADFDKIVHMAQEAGPAQSSANEQWRKHILWVDDRPENNTYERRAFEAIGLRFTLVLSTKEALDRITQEKYATIISDMGRREGPREGYVLLDQLRTNGDNTPLFFYASSNAPEHKRETEEHGGQGCTNNAKELFDMVTRAIIRRQTA